jgi:hypothetical protein
MTKIQVIESKTIKGRPHTIEISGFIGQNRFRANLEGVCLNILTPTSLDPEQLR